MAKVSFNDEPKINVNLQGTNQINATMQQTETTNVDLPPINYIPGYKEAEAERRANEVVRQENEANRIALYEDMEYKLETGYFNGEDGEDGFSPIANVSKTGDTATITITDKDGTTTASISDGTDGVDGQDGQDGQDGYSPTATVTKTGKVATITITDKDGTTTAEIRDGEDGTGTGDMLKSTYDTNDNGIVDNAEKVNNHTVGCDVPADAVFTDTTYTAGTGIDITNGVISNTQTSANWGNITGTLSNQTDLQNALDGKADNSDIPTKTSDLTNDSGFITGVPRADETHWNGYTFVKGDGVMEIGKYIDFHNDTSGTDKSLRLVVQGNYNNNVNLPTASGTLALTSDIVDNEVLVGDESQATSDTKLIVESDDLEPQGLEITNSYNTATNMAYSCDYVNKLEEWTKLTASGVNASITLPADYKEIRVIALRSSAYQNWFIGTFTKDMLINSGDKYYRAGHYTTSSDNSSCTVRVKTDLVSLADAYVNGSAVTSDIYLFVYYR